MTDTFLHRLRPWLRKWWWQTSRPSLTRRLVLAQMAVAALLWLLLMGFVAQQIEMGSKADDLALMRAGASIVLPLAHALRTQPELLQQTLRRLDDFQRANVVPASGQSMLRMPRVYLWGDSQLLYNSIDAPPNWKAEQTGALFTITMDGLPWHAYAEESVDGRYRFATMAPASTDAAGLTPWSTSWMVLPLLVSLPLLVLPAWWSVRFALRPWARLTGEIASRASDDLSPLQFTPAHRELSPLSSAINQWLARLRNARSGQRNFVADAAHELRTPIAAMQISAEALRQRSVTTADKELLDNLLGSNARAAGLVAQLLMLTRSDASHDLPVTATIDMEPLVQDALAQAAGVAKAKGVELDLESQPKLQVWGDAESLRFLVDNLVGNAIKYSPAGATVRVRLEPVANGVRLEVIDEGPGIAPELWARVFDRFYRAPNQTESGSGLGLSIAKTVADKHRATIDLSDGPSRTGLRVTVRFQCG